MTGASQARNQRSDEGPPQLQWESRGKAGCRVDVWADLGG